MEIRSFSDDVAAASMLSYSSADEPPASGVVVAPDSFYFIAIHNGPAVSTRMEGYGPPREASLVSGSINLIPPGTRSSWSWSQTCRSIRLYLPATVVNEAIEESNGSHFTDLEPLLALNDPVIREVAFRLAGGMIDPLDRLYQESATRFLAVHLLQMFANRYKLKKAVSSQRISRLSDVKIAHLSMFLQENLHLSLSHEVMARQVHLSASRFAHAFKAATGESPHRYVMRLRCQRAVELIRSNVELSDIAVRCGFADQSHIGRCVRRFTERSPALLRLD